jgi:hypothetical protein
MTTESGIEELLFNEGTLFDLDIGRWAAIKKMKATEVLLEGVDEKAVYLGHKRLLPPEAMKDLMQLEGKARRILDSKSMQFPIAGARFVYLQSLNKLVLELADVRDDYLAEVDVLIARYPSDKASQLERLNKMAEELHDQELQKFVGKPTYGEKKTQLDLWLKEEKEQNASKYPDVSSLRDRFRFDWHIFKVSQFTGDGTTLTAEQVADAQRKLQKELTDWVKEAAASMHQTLGEAALQAKNLLQRHNKVHPRNLKPLFDAFETFKSIDFTGSSDMQSIIDSMRNRFGVRRSDGELDYEQSAEFVNSGGSQAEFLSLLDTMSQLAVAETAQQAGLAAIRRAGRFARVIED